MNWYIGQEVVCVKTHSEWAVIKDKHYIINAIRKSPCRCTVDLDVGIRFESGYKQYVTICRKCGNEGNQGTDKTRWLHEILFAPLMDISELEEILNEEIQRV